MTKPNRALKVIDKNSLPKLLDILEVPKVKAPEASNEVSKTDPSGENAGPILSIRQRKRRRKPFESSKTPKINNLGGSKNITTKRGQARNNRPPIQPSISSATKKRKFGGTPLTPYGMQMARLKNRSGGITPSLRKSPNLRNHYDRLKPIACNLYNQHQGMQQKLGRFNGLLGSATRRNGGLDQKTTINNTPPVTRTPNASMKKLRIAPSKSKSGETKLDPQESIRMSENYCHNANKHHDSADDMDCDSSDELCLNSSSSSSFSPPPNEPKQLSSGNSSTHKKERDLSDRKDRIVSTTRRKNQLAENVGDLESNPKSSSNLDDTAKSHLQKSLSSFNRNSDNTTLEMNEGTQQESAPLSTTSTTPIDDINVFNLVMGNHRSGVSKNELLGATIGGSHFFRNNIDEDSVLTAVSNEKVKRSVLRTPRPASQISGSSPPLSRQQKKQQVLSRQIHEQPNDSLEEESIEAWSIDGHGNSPFFFEIGGKKYGHPALPPGWTMRISRGENRPVYSHPDHGVTWHCPIKLTPNMVYTKTSNGKFVKQIRSNRDSLEKDSNMPRFARDKSHTPPKTPPSVLSFGNKSSQQELLSNTTDTDEAQVPQEDHDSTCELMIEISELSRTLIEKSSSNLQKVEKVKTIHQNTSDLSKNDVSSAKELESDQESRELSSTDSKTILLSISTSRSTLSQDHEQETPSTMTTLLQQYEQSRGRYSNLNTLSETQPQSSKMKGVPNGATTTRNAKKLSPITESKNTDRIEAWFTPTEEIMHSKSLEPSSILRFDAKKKGRQPCLNGSQNLLTNRELQENSNLEVIPTLITVNCVGEPGRDSPILYDDEWSPLAQSKFAEGKNHLDEHQTYESSSESPLRNNAIPVGKLNQDITSLEAIDTPVKDPSMPYNNERSQTDSDKNLSRRQHSENTPESPLQHDYQPLGVTKNSSSVTQPIEELDSIDFNNEHFGKSGGRQEGSHFTTSVSSAHVENDNESDKVRSIQEPSTAINTQQLSQLKSTDETALDLQETNDALESKENDDETRVPQKEKEIGSNAKSSGAPFKCDSEALGSVATDIQYSPEKNCEPFSVTIAVQAHGSKKKAPSVIDGSKKKAPSVVDKSERRTLERTKQSVKNQASATSCRGRSNVSFQNDNEGVEHPRTKSKSCEEIKPNVVASQGTKSDEDKSTISTEGFHQSKTATSDAHHLETEYVNEQSTRHTGEISILDSVEQSSDNGPTDDFDVVDDGAGSCDGSFTFTDDISEIIQNSSEKVQRKHISLGIKGDATGKPPIESPIESPMKPTKLEQHDSYQFPEVENSDFSTESPNEPSKLEFRENLDPDLKSTSFIPRKHNRMSWRVLNPPHPICSLQRLEELMFLERKRTKFRGRRPKKGGRTKRKRISAGRRRKSKGVGRR